MRCPKCGSKNFYCVATTYDSAVWDEDQRKLVILLPEPILADSLRELYDKIVCQECEYELDWKEIGDVVWKFE